MGLNRGRIWVGGLVGGVVWVVWGFVTTFVVIGMGRYQAAQNAGFFLKEPRYAGFQIQWIVVEFILAIILAHLYAWVRSSLGPGPEDGGQSRRAGRFRDRVPVEFLNRGLGSV